MSEFLLKPKEQELEKDEAAQAEVQFDFLGDELKGAIEAEGAENVHQAVAEVVAGQARPDALLEWMDDLRDPEEQYENEDDNLERSFTVDFIPDTMRDGGATDAPPHDDYMFSAAAKKHDWDDGDGDGGGGGGGGGGGDDGEGGEAGDGADDKGKPKSGAANKGSPDAKAKPAPSKPEAPSKSSPSKGTSGGKSDDNK